MPYAHDAALGRNHTEDQGLKWRRWRGAPERRSKPESAKMRMKGFARALDFGGSWLRHQALVPAEFSFPPYIQEPRQRFSSGNSVASVGQMCRPVSRLHEHILQHEHSLSIRTSL